MEFEYMINSHNDELYIVIMFVSLHIKWYSNYTVTWLCVSKSDYGSTILITYFPWPLL